ncbi:MAG: cytochrome b N-terminal domain-containing protein [Candidatus Obscuribacterales bacterium]|nr:cytochrome b N-terminal domain-containing protein [Candidatus Obscuribacterales bacterium]
MSAYTESIKGLNSAVLVFEDGLNKIMTSKYNPMYYHGALPQFYLWVLYLSGLLLFAYYMPTIDNAYDSKNLVNAYTSVEYITKNLPFGAIFRGMHRYAGDAMVITILIHAVRVWFTDRYRQYRWVQWLSGIALLGLVLFIGQTGYYLVWDERSLLLTRMTVSAFDALGPLGPGLKTWFLNGDTITNLTLSNFLFIHIGLSFFLLFGLWVHYVRMTRPIITPPPAINYILVAILLAVVFAIPIVSGPMANINSQPTSFDIDWWFLWPYAMMSALPLTGYWIAMALITIAVCILPAPIALLTRTGPVEAAEVVLTKCVGCSLCANDCPFQAIEMVPAPAGSRFKLLATVKPYRCSGCGVCVGACAFDAIDLPNLLDSDVNAQIKAMVEAK